MRTQDLLKRLAPDLEQERRTLQRYGERLDKETKGAWVRDGLQSFLLQAESAPIVIVDSARIEGQVESIRESYGQAVVHVHLTAELSELGARYRKRADSGLKELPSYDEVRRNKTERRIDELAKIADIVVQTDRCTPGDVLIRVASQIGLYGRENNRQVDVLVGGQYGSEGKGQIAAYLAPEYDLLVRVGGPNAGHSVFEEPKPYVFHHLPSGTRCSNAQLMLGPGAVIYVPQLQKEISECGVSCDRLTIDPQAMIISKADIRLERRLQETIGSTGRGVGKATARRILDRGNKRARLAGDVKELEPFVRDTYRLLEDAFRHEQRILLEGTQGTGLSIFHGSYPHVTSRDTTVAGCLAEAGISPNRVRKVIMVCRTYPIRVEDPKKENRTSGPMSQEIDWQTVADRCGHKLSQLEQTERTSTTDRKRRVGEFDWVLLRKAASLNAPTDIAVTFADYIVKENENAHRFEQLSEETIRFIEEIEKVAAAPVSLIATRFHSRAIIDRRAW